MNKGRKDISKYGDGDDTKQFRLSCVVSEGEARIGIWGE